MTTPCLTRQNAFLLEDYELYSPLDWFCSVCCQVSETRLVQPCHCIVKSKPYLAHEKCFLDWSDRNGRPRYCTRCKARYSPTKGFSRLEKLIFTAITLSCCYAFYLLAHLYRCFSFMTFRKSDIESQFGAETFNHMPDTLVMPTISAQCWKSSFATSTFFISLSFFFAVFLCAISVALMATRYVFYSRLTK